MKSPASLYDRVVLPWLLNATMRQEMLAPYRRRALAQVTGRVLEIGIGSGVNLELYPRHTREVMALDPSMALLSRARAVTPGWLRVTLLRGSAEDLPIRSGSIDTVVTTWTLCSIPDVRRALVEARRVLAPDGRLLFVEHGVSPEPRVSRWQQRLTPLWRRVAGGCHLDRHPGELLARAGFRLERLEAGYMRGPRIMTYMYEGSARPSEAR